MSKEHGPEKVEGQAQDAARETVAGIVLLARRLEREYCQTAVPDEVPTT
jgi:hypothetical protein